jgi:phage-related protein
VKEIRFLGSSRQEISLFPTTARSRAGHELYLTQLGEDPGDFKPMPTVGKGVFEIRIRDQAGAFRVLYVAKFVSCVYVLHAFQKKTQKTAQQALRVAAQRYGLIEEK